MNTTVITEKTMNTIEIYRDIECPVLFFYHSTRYSFPLPGGLNSIKGRPVVGVLFNLEIPSCPIVGLALITDQGEVVSSSIDLYGRMDEVSDDVSRLAEQAAIIICREEVMLGAERGKEND